MKEKIRTHNSPIHFPGLNGIRGIASLAVVISHTTLALGQFGLDPFVFGAFKDGNARGLDLAGFGVSVFFALSGFLITYLLLLEADVQGINIVKFYTRRALRIWPLYYLYLFVVFSLILVNKHIENFNFNSSIYYIFFVANIPFILGTTLPLLAHYWSIGVEEQFYLIWPWIVKYSKNSLLIGVVVFVCIILSTKSFLHFFYPNSLLESIIHITRIHCMLIGAIGALYYKSANKLLANLAMNKLTQGGVWLIFILVAINKFHVASFIDNELISVATTLLILGQINHESRLINLEFRIMDFIGKISYGIYIIHPLVIFLLSVIFGQLSNGGVLSYIFIYLLVLALTIGLATISYFCFERKFIQIKETKFSVVNSQPNIVSNL